ncbi:hypothetical protein CHI12_11840 [Terribacillus saccharophilus]|uniref:Uncharacterized protein n=1 Tax=Terribacillus saccharophilus TaxID=361277 RepID=A0A268HBR4_9BACI|nr:hypothetical protein [Terribacillus saccharophilus]PAE07327.1 hypothetical protein CHI12_11840 [Terribacillus saccharophilus]
MQLKTKHIITVTSILLGSITIGGSAVYAFNLHKHDELVADARNELKTEKESLASTLDILKRYETKSGYLSNELNQEDFESIRNKLENVKDSSTDFSLDKDELKDEINVIKLDKQEIADEVSRLEAKLEAQNAVNNLFIEKAIIEADTKDIAVSDDISKDKIDGVKELLGKRIEEETDWSKALLKLTENADSQLIQINKTEKTFEKMFTDGSVNTSVTRTDYETAKEQLEKVKNENSKKKLEEKLGKVLTQVENNEKQAKKEAEERAKQKAKEEAQTQVEKSSSNNSTQPSGGPSNSSVPSRNISKTSGSTTESTSPQSNSNGSSYESSSSHSDTSSSSSNKSSNASSNVGSGSSDTSSSNGGGTTAIGKKTGEGKIKNYGGSGESGSTYEKGTFDAKDLDGVPWDSFTTSN